MSSPASPASTPPTPLGGGPALLAVRDVRKYYGDDRAPALEHVNLELRAGEFVALEARGFDFGPVGLEITGKPPLEDALRCARLIRALEPE